MLRKTVLTRGDAARFASALRALLTQPSFRAAARLASERLRAVRVPYSVQAADWVEYAAALRGHGGFLHTQGQAMPRWQAGCLDVAALALLLASLPAAWAYRVWAAGRGRGASGGGAAGGVPAPPGLLSEDSLVSVQLMLPPAQQAAAKHIAQRQAQQAAGGGGGGGGEGGAAVCSCCCRPEHSSGRPAAAGTEAYGTPGQLQPLRRRQGAAAALAAAAAGTADAHQL
jgi:hypothetical protein